MDAPRKFPEREEMTLQIADLIFVRLADIENEKIIPAIEAGLEFARSNFRHLHGGAGSFFAAHAAEFVVIDQLGDRAMRTAHRAIGFLRSLSSRNFIPRASNKSKRPTRFSPQPRISLMVSIAWIEPTIPGRTPRTPPSAQEGTSPGGGGSG